uniref:Integron gene cassette protein n=1 Tax=Globodera pallida TaxID=36090 RepID=A0A183CR81_GLOPA
TKKASSPSHSRERWEFVRTVIGGTVWSRAARRGGALRKSAGPTTVDSGGTDGDERTAASLRHSGEIRPELSLNAKRRDWNRPDFLPGRRQRNGRIGCLAWPPGNAV